MKRHFEDKNFTVPAFFLTLHRLFKLLIRFVCELCVQIQILPH